VNISGHDIAVCSWSLRPKDMQDLARMMGKLGLEHAQLMLLNLVELDDKRLHLELGHLRAARIQFTGGMMSFPGEDYSTIDAIHRTGGFLPDDLWAVRRGLCLAGAKLAQQLGMKSIGTHVGFVPPAGEAKYQTMISRVREIAQIFSQHGLDLLMETGQERADSLLAFLNDLATPNIHINFDPANMILYGAGDPIAAVRTLGRHIRHVHVKDATPSSKPGVDWGEEVPFGTGKVNPRAFLSVLHEVGYKDPLAIEREAGENRVGDVRTAIEALKQA
jgi:hydroxypyruvate isomerase